MLKFNHQMTRPVEKLVGLGPAFDGAWVASAGTIRHLILGNDFQQLSDELFLLLAGTGLSDSDTELANPIQAVESQPLQRFWTMETAQAVQDIGALDHTPLKQGVNESWMASVQKMRCAPAQSTANRRLELCGGSGNTRHRFTT